MKCKICKSNDITIIFKHRNHIGLSKCNNCKVVFTYPKPKKQEIQSFYDDKNYFKHWFEYKDIKYVTDNLRVDKLKNYVHCGTLLDYGSGLGYFLDAASKKGFTSYGIETSKFGVEYSNEHYNFNTIQYSGLPLPFKDNFFEAISIWHVLEHIEEPIELLKEFKRILKPNGYLIIEVPNLNGILSVIRGKKKLPLIEHLFHYTPSTLNSLLKISDFRILETTPGNPGYTRKGFKIFIKKCLAYLGIFIFNISKINFGDTILTVCQNNKKE
jgi:SAM-dependent methyltransferase